MTLSQVLAPQLQQSLALLQAPTLELKAMVAQELEQNPMLEELEITEMTQEEKESRETEDTAAAAPADPAEPPADVAFDPATEKDSNAPVDDFQAELERLTQLDQEWRDHFAQTNLPIRQNQDDEEKRQFMFDSLVSSMSLQESLLEQVRMSDLMEDQRQIAEMVIGNIDDYGYLQSSVDELSFATNIRPEKIFEVLKIIQTFHPTGIGARDLRECLLLQLERDGKQDTLEYRIISECMEALGKRRIPEIARTLDTTVEEVQSAIARIANLEPRPGRAFLSDSNQYILPEVFVQKVGVREKIRAGKFLIKSLHQRQQTILNIAKEIVKRQREFMEKGVAFLKPLTMVQVAEVVGVHETTVSRAVSGKYMETPQGIYEMKYFFTSGIQTTSGVGVSNTSVKELIADMIKEEKTSKPLSDEEIVKLLTDKGIKIARRTVAKYRFELNILPSHLRKVY